MEVVTHQNVREHAPSVPRRCTLKQPQPLPSIMIVRDNRPTLDASIGHVVRAVGDV
jgi:hypothetical protein